MKKNYIKPFVVSSRLEGECLVAVSFGLDDEHGASAEESLAREDCMQNLDEEKTQQDYDVWEQVW